MKIKKGMKLRSPEWKANCFIIVTAVGNKAFLGYFINSKGIASKYEEDFRFDHCEWERVK